ncbi:MAG: leucine--tRNA ligase [Acidobacteria bacterium]|nr:leucine--tRNA ligase [Acidobacteriota bacterium]
MSEYRPAEFEEKWRERWEREGVYRSKVDWERPKHYALTMLPYPSGDLHLGHWFAMVPSDARARFKRMKGFNVLFPMGFDAFGLPAENAAIQRGIHPWKWTYENIENMRRQFRSMGAMFDWEREAVSCTPEFYRWTEWFFNRFLEGGLAYRGEALVNWSESLQTVLANEQVIDGKDERTGQPVVQKLMSQWFFRITQYADELLEFDEMDWPEAIRKAQTNWIGRSEGARVAFTIEGETSIEVFTTRPDTLWGATFMVLAPEHDLVDQLTSEDQREQIAEYVAAAAKASEIERSAEDREKTGVFTGSYAQNPASGEKIPIWIADYVMVGYGTGAIMAVPAHDQRDFEFARKFDLEVRPVITSPEGVVDAAAMTEAYVGAGAMFNSGPIDGTRCTDSKGRSNPAIAAAIEWLEDHEVGREAINYRLRDWLISRQRYWGCPIPVVRRADGEYETVPDDSLPVELPQDVEFMPTGRSPLKSNSDFMAAVAKDGGPAERETDTMDTFMCSSWYQYRYLSPGYDGAPFDPEEAAYWLPVDTYTGGAEHATMHLLYTRFFTKAMRDLGMFEDAATVMRQRGRDPGRIFDEPMVVLRNQGQVLGGERSGDVVRATGSTVGNVLHADRVEVVGDAPASCEPDEMVGEIMRRTENILTLTAPDGGLMTVEVEPDASIDIPGIDGVNSVGQLRHHLEVQRMSKSKGNVVNPDVWVDRHGADVLRAYLMFGFDWAKGGPFDSGGMQGVARWLQDVWAIGTTPPTGPGDPEQEAMIERRLHQTIEQVERGLEEFSFNTAIAALMAFRNDLRAALREDHLGDDAWRATMDVMVRLLGPFAPHTAEELWERLGGDFSVHAQEWPAYDPEKAAEDTVTLVVLVNGKVRDRVDVAADVGQDEARTLGLATEGARRYIGDSGPRKVIFIPARKGQEPKLNIVV